jgi:hypothetical protein
MDTLNKPVASAPLCWILGHACTHKVPESWRHVCRHLQQVAHAYGMKHLAEKAATTHTQQPRIERNPQGCENGRWYLQISHKRLLP